MADRLLFVSVAGLSHPLATDETSKILREMGSAGLQTPIEPTFPAVTCTTQASTTTGRNPAHHGMVGNGFFDRESLKGRFWEQPDRLVTGPRIWEVLREAKPDRTTAMLFWQNSMGSANDLVLTPAPLHKHDGGMIMDCYGVPDGLYPRLTGRHGPFKLWRYWGPLASHEASDWIAVATADVLRNDGPDLVLTYLPHMDYNQQRYGPDHSSVAEDLVRLDGHLATMREAARERGYAMWVAGDYAIAPVTGAIFPNRLFREEGWLPVRRIRGMTYPDFPRARAFALADHQVAHIYCERNLIDRVCEKLLELSGIERVLGPAELRHQELDHARCGDLVAVSFRDRWFAYPWWEDDAESPDYATHVDIHNKPGYDPVELFGRWAFRWPPIAVSTDASKIGGSHGRPPDTDADRPAFVADVAPETVPKTDRDLFGAILGFFGVNTNLTPKGRLP